MTMTTMTTTMVDTRITCFRSTSTSHCPGMARSNSRSRCPACEWCRVRSQQPGWQPHMAWAGMLDRSRAGQGLCSLVCPAAVCRPEPPCPLCLGPLLEQAGVALAALVQETEAERVLADPVSPHADVPRSVPRDHGIVMVPEDGLELLHPPGDATVLGPARLAGLRGEVPGVLRLLLVLALGAPPLTAGR